MANLKIENNQAKKSANFLTIKDVKVGEIFSWVTPLPILGGGYKKAYLMKITEDDIVVNLETGNQYHLSIDCQPISLYKGYLTLNTNDFITTKEELKKYG